MLPKSLHTVRILAAVAAQSCLSSETMPVDMRERAILRAAALLGYPDASAYDPRISAATRALAKVRS